MASRNLNGVIRYLRRLAGAANGDGASDAELLERYVHCRDEAAFELLLWRHGALVYNVCRRVLRNEQDTEDAFQATFLTFVRKSGSIGRRDSLSSWLYKVAYRIALAARERARKTAEREVSGGEEVAVQPCSETLESDVRSILDEELNRLAERFRRPMVLCYLEGKSNEEAAQELGCRLGTIYSRLARGREILRRRLRRRGVELPVVGLTAALAGYAAAAPPTTTLILSTVRTALRYAASPSAVGISPQVTGLAEGVLRTMFVAKLKMTALAVVVVGLFAAGGVLTRQAWTADPRTEEPKLQAAAQKQTDGNDKEKKPVVSVVQPKRGGIKRSWQHPGYIRAAAQQQVYPAVSGYLKQPRVDLGDRVKKGDLLAEIAAPSLEIDLKQARAALALERGAVALAESQVMLAQAEERAAKDRIKAAESRVAGGKASVEFREKQYKRYAALYDQRAIDSRLVDEQRDRLEVARAALIAEEAALINARSDANVSESKIQTAKVGLEMAKAKSEMAQLTVEKAQLQLDLTRIHAHLDGIVTQRNFDAGDFVSANETGTRRPLLTVMQTDSVRVVVEITEDEIPFTHPGLPVQLFSSVVPDLESTNAKVSRTGFAVEKRTHTMPIEIDVPNRNSLLRPGMMLTAALEWTPTDAFMVPFSAVLNENSPPSVYVVRDGKAHLTPVKIGLTDGGENLWEILSGIESTDRIVVDPKNLHGKIVPVEIKKAR